MRISFHIFILGKGFTQYIIIKLHEFVVNRDQVNMTAVEEIAADAKVENCTNNRCFFNLPAFFFIFGLLFRSFQVIFPKINPMPEPVMRLLAFFNVLRIN